MNMWGFTPDFVSKLSDGFVEFLDKTLNRGEGDPMKAEYLLPNFVEELLQKNEVDVKVLPSKDTWYGLTYKEDIPAVREAFKRMVSEGTYSSPLF